MESWFELEDKIVRRLARAQTEPNLPGFTFDAKHREMADRWVAANKAPALKPALDMVGGGELRIRKARLAGLFGKDLETVKENEARRIFQNLENDRAAKLQRVYTKIVAAMKRHAAEADADPVRSLLALERSKLRYGDHGEPEAVNRLRVMAERGKYDEADVDVLASRGTKARAAAEELRRSLPPGLANEDGAELLAEAERLVDLPPGTVEYIVEGTTAVQRVNVLSLINSDTKPSPAEFAPAPSA